VPRGEGARCDGARSRGRAALGAERVVQDGVRRVGREPPAPLDEHAPLGRRPENARAHDDAGREGLDPTLQGEAGDVEQVAVGAHRREHVGRQDHVERVLEHDGDLDEIERVHG
jgi:hypothetical protein